MEKNYFKKGALSAPHLRFSSKPMQMLIKKQMGVTQNIVVNYSYNDHGNALMQAILPIRGSECQSVE